MATASSTAAAESAMQELKSAIAKLWETKEHSDLTIKCGKETFNVHKFVLWPRSKFFEKACYGGFKEAKDKMIKMPEEEPAMIKRMLIFCYKDVFSMAKEADEEEWKSCAQVAAALYVLGDKYGIQSLKRCAESKFARCMEVTTHLYKTEDLRGIMSVVYEGTLDTDRSLRGPLVTYIQLHWKELTEKSGFRVVLADYPDLAFDLVNSKPMIIKQQPVPPKALCENSCSHCHRTNPKWKVNRVICECGWWVDYSVEEGLKAVKITAAG